MTDVSTGRSGAEESTGPAVPSGETAGSGLSGQYVPADALCTPAQIRRFIKSRPYVPMHELRRRFELNGECDDVTPIQTATGVVYVGLPVRESHIVEDLVRQGDVGIELSQDPRTPIAIGLFPMRPVSRS